MRQKQYECQKHVFFQETLVRLYVNLQRAPECRSQADIVKGKAFSATVQTQDHRKFTVGLGSSSNCALIISCSRYHFLPKSTYFDVFLGCSCCAFRCKKLTSRPLKLAWSHALATATKAMAHNFVVGCGFLRLFENGRL